MPAWTHGHAVGAAAVAEPPIPMEGTSGVWEDVTPAGISLATSINGSDSFGVAAPFKDPVNAHILYCAADHQGLWKSEDYGATWVKVNTGSGGSDIDSGFAWGSDIAHDGSYILVNNGYGGATIGTYKSTDGGVSWAETADRDDNVLMVNKGDKNHVLALPHGSTGNDHLFESTDAGETWSDLGVAPFGIYGDGRFLNSTTAMVMSPTGLWQGVKSGTWTWTNVFDMTGPHGGLTMCPDLAGTYFYVGGQSGVTDNGIIVRCPIAGGGANGTWEIVHDMGGASLGPSSIAATPTYLYAQGTFATTGTYSGRCSFRATAASGEDWAEFAFDAGQLNGPHKLVAVTDGDRWAIVGAYVNSGIWRRIE